jgi:hypothetical protein
LLEILSDYGRVLHYEVPKDVGNPNLPSKEELLDYLYENPEYDIHGNKKPISVKIINHIIDKGIVETYYIPKNEENEEIQEESSIISIKKLVFLTFSSRYPTSPSLKKSRLLKNEIFTSRNLSYRGMVIRFSFC